MIGASFDIPAVMENPLEVALGTCWPWADNELGDEIRGQWVSMISEASGAARRDPRRRPFACPWQSPKACSIS